MYPAPPATCKPCARFKLSTICPVRTGDGSCTYTYDGENQLIGVSVCASAAYTYNAEGRRVRTVVNGATADITLDAQRRIADQFSANGTGWAWSGMYLDGEQVASYANGTTYFHHGDWLGTERAVSGVTGASSASCASLPFGDDSSCSGSGFAPLQFTSQYHDTETGLDAFPARHYASAQGRFLSPDPAGVAAVDPDNPQSWNRYAYTFNDPTGYFDPNGRDAIAVDFTNMAYGFGHEGIVVLRADGTAEYARFGPVPAGSATGQGQVLTYDLGTIQLGPDGTPTAGGFQQLAHLLAKAEGQSSSTVRMNYFATTPQGTAALDNYIAQTKAESDAGKLPNYNVLKCNCANYAVGGLYASGAVGDSGLSMMPNELYDQLVILALENWANGALQPAQKACVEWDDQ